LIIPVFHSFASVFTKVLPICDYAITVAVTSFHYSHCRHNLKFSSCGTNLMKPFLDLRHIAIDPSLVQNLPHALAHYYEALPVAREGDSVTVAMSHPENLTALAVLRHLLGAEIVPIRTDGAAVRAALQQLYLSKAEQTLGILGWLPAHIQSAWASMLADVRIADSHMATTELPMTWLDADQVDAETLLAVAHGGNYQLTLCAMPDASIRTALLHDVHAPLWLVAGAPVMPKHILLVLRGFASDEVALNWTIRLSARTSNVDVALLPLLGQAPWGALSYLQTPGPAQAHITDCATRLSEVGIHPTLTLQSGDTRQQVVQAVRQGAYDLIVIAAEGHGHFVGQVIADLEEECRLPLGGVLVLKPSHEHTQRLPYNAASTGTITS
jgi:nucleotide-binding universal stress UspA family protein